MNLLREHTKKASYLAVKNGLDKESIIAFLKELNFIEVPFTKREDKLFYIEEIESLLELLGYDSAEFSTNNLSKPKFEISFKDKSYSLSELKTIHAANRIFINQLQMENIINKSSTSYFTSERKEFVRSTENIDYILSQLEDSKNLTTSFLAIDSPDISFYEYKGKYSILIIIDYEKLNPITKSRLLKEFKINKNIGTEGYYIYLANRLLKLGKITKGKYEELLLDANRIDLVYGIDMEKEDL